MHYDPFAYDIDSLGMIAEIAYEFQGTAEELSAYNSDYINEYKTMHKEYSPKCKKIELYEMISYSISEDFGEFRGELCNLLSKIYYNHKRISTFRQENPEIYALILEGIGLLETVRPKSDEAFLFYEVSLGFHGDIEYMKAFDKYYGSDRYFRGIFANPNPKLLIKKNDELTLADYQEAFRSISDFIEFVEHNKEIIFNLNKLASQLLAYCKFEMCKELGEKSKIQNWEYYTFYDFLQSRKTTIQKKPITLRAFIKTYCNCKDPMPRRLAHWRKCLNNEHMKGNIQLPKCIDEKWSTGKAKYYQAEDLIANWQSYRDHIASLPLLK
ncbi:MAG: hypothetical protein ABSE89_08855 [Sedimentisphaerales bacterium]